ncbi:DUF397 domain-containing protein [Streptomyces sp. NPDC095613]|uniref:DUF397 domain-containing protein n=1 Tax=Streptomyces sp. NPDC095613 TaxID=3155540 RepID=UPI003323BE23
MEETRIAGTFRKSSYSGQAGNCLEFARTLGGGGAVRDSKDPRRGTQLYAPAEWEAFISTVKAGGFGRFEG